MKGVAADVNPCRFRVIYELFSVRARRGFSEITGCFSARSIPT